MSSSPMLAIQTTQGIFLMPLEATRPSTQFRDVDTINAIQDQNLVIAPSQSKAIISFFKMTADLNKTTSTSFYRVSMSEKISAISRSHGYLFTGTPSGAISLYNYEDGTLVRQFSAHFGEITSMLVANDRYLITASADSTVKVYSLFQVVASTSPKPLATFKGHHEKVVAVRMESSEIAVSMDITGNLKKFNILTGQETFSHASPTGDATCMAVSWNSVWTGHKNGHVQVHDQATETAFDFPAHDTALVDIVFSADLSLAFTASASEVRVWDWRTKQSLRTLTNANLERGTIGRLAIFQIGGSCPSTLKPFQRVLSTLEKLGRARVVKKRSFGEIVTTAKRPKISETANLTAAQKQLIFKFL